jgi:hypothetical protein
MLMLRRPSAGELPCNDRRGEKQAMLSIIGLVEISR